MTVPSQNKTENTILQKQHFILPTGAKHVSRCKRVQKYNNSIKIQKCLHPDTTGSGPLSCRSGRRLDRIYITTLQSHPPWPPHRVMSVGPVVPGGAIIDNTYQEYIIHILKQLTNTYLTTKFLSEGTIEVLPMQDSLPLPLDLSLCHLTQLTSSGRLHPQGLLGSHPLVLECIPICLPLGLGLLCHPNGVILPFNVSSHLNVLG